MNTPAHLIFAAAAFARPYQRRRTIAAIAGALAPDLSLYLMASAVIFAFGFSPHYVFDVLYFSENWQRVFAVDNSFIVWAVAFGLALWRKVVTAQIFTASALMHLAFDFPLHHDDARPHFWPISDWVFQSPLSYWDQAHYSGIVGPVEMALSLLFCLVLIRRFESLRSRVLICCLAAVQFAPLFIWALVFASEVG